MFSTNSAIFSFVLLITQTMALIELPKVDDNNILLTEAAIRDTINTLFFSLNLRGIKNKPRLKEYSTVHNHLISFTIQDYNNLKEVAKLARVPRNNINNETANFMAAINELLNEDNDVEITDLPDRDDESVIQYVNQFLTRLKDFKKQYGVNDKNYHIKEDVYQVLKDDDVLSYNLTMDNAKLSEFGERDILLGEIEFWKPEQDTRRIFRGDRTKIKYFPFMASIQIFNKFHCGGCIIKSDLVITASSCLQLAWNNRFFRENPAFLSVRIGSNFYNGGGENIPVLEVYFHPDYNPKNLWNNLCLLRLVRKLNIKNKKRVKKIDFDRKATSLPMTTDGITIIGWGARGASNIIKNAWENILAFAVLDIYPLRECQEIYSKEYVTHKNFCAGFFSKGGGACNHDVGGPGIVNGILVGIVSFGSPVCGTPDAPTVFTKLGYYTDWIEEIMEMDVPNTLQRTTKKIQFNFPTISQYRPTMTTFKIPPLVGKLKPIPITEVDALRMLANGNLFKEFLSTMFHEKDALNYEDLFQVNLREKVNNQTDPRSISEVSEPELAFEETTPMGPILATQMGYVDPDIKDYFDVSDTVTSQPGDSERAFANVDLIEEPNIIPDTASVVQNMKLVDTIKENLNAQVTLPVMELATATQNLADPHNMDENLHGLMTIDKHLEGLAEIDKQIDDLVNADKEKLQPSKIIKNAENNLNNVTIGSVRNDKDKNIEKDLVNLIDNLHLKEIIDTMPSVEEDKLVRDEKVVQLFHETEAQRKKDKNDDSILTLLYLSSSEKATTNPKGVSFKSSDYGQEDDDDDDEDDDENPDGISIEANAFKDMTYRNSNASSVFDALTRKELDNLLARHLQHIQPNVW